MRTNKKRFSLLKKTALLGAAFAVAFGINGCSDGSSVPTFTPFERIATLDVVMTEGEVDYVATYAKAQAVADAIHAYIEGVDDVAESGFPANWIIGGSDEDPATPSDAILQIPSVERIDPAADASPANTYKIKVMDICNSYYAKMALGVTPVIKDDDDLNNADSIVDDGFIHAPTLPCEVTVYNDGDNIYVDMLNPEAIFSLFFSDVVYGTQMEDAAFAEAMMQLPTDVKGELKTIVYAGLDAAGLEYTALSDKLGPAYTQDQIADVVDDSPYGSPYLHYAYMKSDGGEFTPAEVKAITQEIMNTMTLDHADNVAEHAEPLEAILSEGSLWRSGRQVPLGLPGVGGFKNFVIEACSPKYAKLALGTGRHHGPALPCEITVTAIQGTVDGPYDTLVISFLEPGFMFTVLFNDAFAAMDAEELATYEQLPVAVLDDLQKIVNYSVAVDIPAAEGLGALVSLGQLTYDMTPE